MKRLTKQELSALLECLECNGGLLKLAEGSLICENCSKAVSNCNDTPVMMSSSNSLFPPEAYETSAGGRPAHPSKESLASKVKSMVPSRSLNLVREKMFERIAKEHGRSRKMVLVVGCGNQEAQLEKYFPEDDTIFVFCDVDKGASADLFCDAHELPFKSEIFDGLITTAVMEHVIRPDQVADEMYRVLKDNGFVYSEIPFLQGVHEGAYDFTRFTMSGHRRLYEKFKEIDVGMVAGPGTNLTWQIVDSAKLLSQNPRISSGLALLARTLFFWVKYTDHIFKRNPKALDAASCTYFYGSRQKQAYSPADIVARYGVSNFSHT